MVVESDERWMKLALKEGQQSLGLTSPNPSVGAVIVREGKLLGSGFHHKAGQPHAEREAIAEAKKAGHNLRGATIYITLEPCSTVGRTGACTTAILENKFSRVVWAIDDPNSNHRGIARQLLESKGIKVKTGICQAEAKDLHRAFFKVQKTGLPWITLKLAMSLDGRLTRPPSESSWLTSKEAREDVQSLRLQADVMLTSGVTARVDDPLLTYRGSCEEKEQPLRIVVSQKKDGGLQSNANLLNKAQSETRFWKSLDQERFISLAKEGKQHVLVEAGGQLAGELFSLDLVDELVVYLSPIICGGETLSVSKDCFKSLADSISLKNISYRKIGSDIRMRGFLCEKNENLRKLLR